MVQGLLTLVPTRNRVENALELLDVWYNTTTEDSSGLIFVVGTEDPRLSEYLHKLPNEHVLTFPERGLVKALNYASPLYWDEYEGIGFMGDDHRPRTLGWDRHYLECLRKNGPGLVYGDDLLMGQQIPTHVFISSPIVKSLGYFGHPSFTHLCVDVAWKDLGESLGRLFYLDHVIVEHMHPAAGKADEDAGYKHVNSKAMVRIDEKALENYRRNILQNEVAVLKEHLGIL